jgi:hypothetical protein
VILPNTGAFENARQRSAQGELAKRFADGKIDLLVPTNAPFRDGNESAHFFKMAPEDGRLRVPYIGGGFGSKNIVNAHLAALFLSRQLGGRPIKLVPSAQHSFMQNPRHAMLFKAKMGVKLDGTITALEVDLVVDTGAYITGAATATHNAAISGWGCYRIPHLRVHGGAPTPTKCRPGIPAQPARFRPPVPSNARWTAWRASSASMRWRSGEKMSWSGASLSPVGRPTWIRWPARIVCRFADRDRCRRSASGLHSAGQRFRLKI